MGGCGLLGVGEEGEGVVYQSSIQVLKNIIISAYVLWTSATLLCMAKSLHHLPALIMWVCITDGAFATELLVDLAELISC